MILSTKSTQMGWTRRTLGVLAGALALSMIGGSASAQFASGSIIVNVLGDGVATLGSAATRATLQQYSTSGVAGPALVLPNTASAGTQKALTNSGSATSEAALSISSNGQYLVMAGYNASAGTAGVVAATGVARVVGRVDWATGAVDTSTTITDGYTTNNIRSAASVDGTGFWTGGTGTGGGTRFVSFGSAGTSTQVSSSLANTRVVGIYGGQLYTTSASGVFQGISSVGTGTPTNSGNTTTALPGFPAAAGPSPYGFFMADLDNTVAGIDTAFVADDRTTAAGGIQRWKFNGTTWTLDTTIGTGVTNIGARGLAGEIVNGQVNLYATTAESSANRLISITDAYANPTIATLATAGTNTIFRGVAFTPRGQAAVPGPSALLPILMGAPMIAAQLRRNRKKA